MTSTSSRSIPLSEHGDLSQLGKPVEQLPPSATLAEIREAFDRDGVVCLRDMIDADTVARLNDLLDPIMEEAPFGIQGSDPNAQALLGGRVKRCCDILSRDPALVENFIAHPRVMELVESVLTKHCTSVLIHQAQAAEIHPDERAQPFHRDNGSLWQNPGPRFHQNISSIVALREFTAETGATRHLVGSHRWPEAVYYDPDEAGGWKSYLKLPRPPESGEQTVTEMSPGSALIWGGEIFHGGGANTSKERVRRTVSSAYCLGWLRGEINQQLMWPPEVARHFSRRIQRLIGYGVEGAVIGCLEMGEDPIRLLED